MIQYGTGGGEAVYDVLVLEGADEHFVNNREKNVSPPVYNTLSHTDFIVPINPGSVPIIPANSTGT